MESLPTIKHGHALPDGGAPAMPADEAVSEPAQRNTVYASAYDPVWSFLSERSRLYIPTIAEEHAERSARAAGGKGPTLVERDDPRYFDLKCWPVAVEGQHWVQARAEQVTAIKDRKAQRKAAQRNAPGTAHIALSPYRGETGKAARTRKRVRLSPYQDNSAFSGRLSALPPLPPPNEFQGVAHQPPALIRHAFPSLIPARPYCADNPRDELIVRPRDVALMKRHVQMNTPKLTRFALFDIDRQDACFATEKAGLPPANFVAVNPENGHSLTGFVLDVPVGQYDASKRGPIQYLAAVERGLMRRLGADPSYSGPTGKNPLHSDWLVEWQSPKAYTLGELATALTKNDMRPFARHENAGYSRNCDAFDDTRAWAYRNVLAFKRAIGKLEFWEARLFQIVEGHNRVFSSPMTHSELRSIAQSIATFTWRRFTEAAFSKRQSLRAQRSNAKRWAGHVAAEKTKPWDSMGISRATYYRNKAKGLIT